MAVCAAGLVGGPWVGLAVSVFATWVAVAHHGLLASIATSMLCGGLAGGLLYCWRPKLAQHPLTGFCLTSGVSLLRSGFLFFFAPHSPAALLDDTCQVEVIASTTEFASIDTAI